MEMVGGAKAKARISRDQDVAFDTPPIDETKITVNKGGIETEVDAIHQGWAEPRDYIPFSWPPDDRQLLDGWLAGITLLIDDLRWLLRRPYHKFWSQVVYDLALAACIDSTLQRLPRPYEIDRLPTVPAVTDAVNTLYGLVLRVALRMATYKESKEHRLSPQLFAKLVYDNYLWDMPRLMDLCAVYAATNASLLQRQLRTLFTHQPAYVEDLQLTVRALPQMLERVEERVTVTQLDKVDTNWEQLWDVVHYVVDVATSLDSFLWVFPDGCTHFLEAQFPTRLASFYDTVVPRLWTRLEAAGDGQHQAPAGHVVRRYLQLARVALLSVFRRILDHCCLGPLREEQTTEHNSQRLQSLGERYLEMMTACLEEQHFLVDYSLQYAVVDDAATVRRACPRLDPARLEYVVDAAVTSAAAQCCHSPPPEAVSPAGQHAAAATAAAESALSTTEPTPSITELAPSAAEPAPSVADVELESMVSHVRDLLPDISRSFVMSCLEHYEFSTELVINALLEDSLPPALTSLDRTMEVTKLTPSETKPTPSETKPTPPETKPTPLETKPDRRAGLPPRRNVHDGDEYDIMTRDDVDLTKFHRGKRLTTGRLARELADKSWLRNSDMRERHELCGSLSTEGSVYDPVQAQYDDEYDDTYGDMAAAPSSQQDDESVLLSERLPNSRWRQPEPDEPEEESGGPRREQFVADPAEVRARQEARRQQMAGHRRGHARARPPAETDVVGGPRGQGQDQQVRHDRRRKTERKSTQARRGADRKARGGML